MKQRILHGATIDAATPAEVAQLIASAQVQEEEKQYHSERGSEVLDGTGAGIWQLKAPRSFGWRCERVTLATTPAAVATVALYQDEVQPSALKEVAAVPASGLYSDGFSNKMYVPAGSSLFVVCIGGPVNGGLSWNIQIELVKVKN